MKEPPSDQSYIDRIRSWAKAKAHGGPRSTSGRATSILPVVENDQGVHTSPTLTATSSKNNAGSSSPGQAALKSTTTVNNSTADTEQTVAPAEAEGAGPSIEPKPASHRHDDPHHQRPTSPTAVNTTDHAVGDGVPGETGGQKKKKKSVWSRFYMTGKMILLHSWINVLLVFVPIGIVTKAIPGCPPGVVFAMNAIAIVPLAGLLSHATETVAAKLGDTIGALLNITFGNAVELIIFMYVCLANLIKTRKCEKSGKPDIININRVPHHETRPHFCIALVKNELRIVQSSLLGSILANLLLILGMSFFLGGLRYREQIYNSTVTQMSACLLSLSVISLVLPTAFHASFSNDDLADEQSLKISRGTSVILLLVYIVYLLFQLKSHAYMYESTPQHIIDEESTPGPAAAWLDSSSSESSSSSDSDSDDSSRSRDTVSKRVRRVIRKSRRRKSSVASLDTTEVGTTRTPSFGTTNISSPTHDDGSPEDSTSRPGILFPRLNSVEGSEEAVEEEGRHRQRKRRHKHSRRHRKTKRRHGHHDGDEASGSNAHVLEDAINEKPEDSAPAATDGDTTRRVDFALTDDISPGNISGAEGNAGMAELTPSSSAARKPFTRLRNITTFQPRNLAPTVFTTQAPAPHRQAPPSGPIPRVRYGIRRTNSLPDRLNQYQFRPPGAMMPSQIPLAAIAQANQANAAAAKANRRADGGDDDGDDEDEYRMSRTSAIILLIGSTALVAVCAEFLVDSISAVTHTSQLGEIFIGLIILPIVGNAAEHVTAITVAMKNKMDLAIGVAVGSSIQIALFITPLVVILGWIIDREMTLYFTLFETVSLFVSAFIVNFLVLDGRSNYLEGALLCSTYIIIGVVAFYYPDGKDASSWGD